MKISQVGEFGLIDLISDMVASHKDESFASWKRLQVGIGDDAVLWKGSDRTQVATTDSLVEGVHFSLKYCDWESLGWKSLAVSLSDIAAMGGYPLYVLASLSFPGAVTVQDIASFYNGMLKLSAISGTAIAGGNLTRSRKVSITTTVIGELAIEGRTLLRSDAKPGDLVALTGFTGLASAGLKVLQGKIKVDRKAEGIFREAFLKPSPRLKEAQLLVRGGVKAAIDISDGLLADLAHICQSSRVEAEINLDAIPVHPLLKENFGQGAAKLALSGGEDYELAFTARESIIKGLKAKIGCPLSIIGRITRSSDKGGLVLIDAKGKPVPMTKQKFGWEHFK